MSTTVHVLGNVAHQPELMEIQTRKGPTHKLQICIASNPAHQSENLCATFTDCEIWGKRAAALANHVGKGDRLYIIGELVTQKWTNKDGDERKKQLIKIDNLHFAGGTRVDPAFDQSPKAKTVQQPAQPAPVFDENIPF